MKELISHRERKGNSEKLYGTLSCYYVCAVFLDSKFLIHSTAKCGEYCKQCDRPGKCNKCVRGYTAKHGKCKRKSNILHGCSFSLECYWPTLKFNLELVCISRCPPCLLQTDHQNWIQQQASEIDLKIPTQCDRPGKCNKCESGYTAKHGKCKRKSNILHGCLFYLFCICYEPVWLMNVMRIISIKTSSNWSLRKWIKIHIANTVTGKEIRKYIQRFELLLYMCIISRQSTANSIDDLASATNARVGIQPNMANVNVSPTYYMVVRFHWKLTHLKIQNLDSISANWSIPIPPRCNDSKAMVSVTRPMADECSEDYFNQDFFKLITKTGLKRVLIFFLINTICIDYGI